MTDTLNPGQQIALDKILQNYRSKGFMLLTGAAGSGKTFVLLLAIKQLIQEGLDPSRIAVSCPTHKLVGTWTEDLLAQGLEEVSVMTIHSLMKVFPDILENGDRPLVSFEDRNPDPKAVKGVLPFDLLICDEAYYYPKILVQTIYSHGYLSTVLAGDSNQLNPVGEDISYLTTITDFSFKINLTENMRQKDKGLKAIVDQVFKSGANYQPDFLSSREFNLKLFEAVKTDQENTLYLAYRNSTCKTMSDMLRSIQGVVNVDLADVGEIIKVNTVSKGSRILIPANSLVRVRSVNTEFNYFDVEYRGNIQRIYKDVSGEEEESRKAAELAKDKKVWVKHYQLVDKFTKYYHPSVSTAHSAQGLTRKKVFINWRDLKKCRDDSKIYYVSASRASQSLYFC